MSITAVAATRASADLFAAASTAQSGATHGKAVTAAIDDCGTVPHKFPGGWPPPPPPPFSELAHFAGVVLQTPSRFADDWCGTVPHKLPFPPPPPPPWVDGINQMLSGR